MLTAIGLTMNFLGAVVLLGSDIEVIEHTLKRVDPLHYAYTSGLNYIIDESMVEKGENDNRAHPYDRPVSADNWRTWPLRRLLERHVEQNIPRHAEIDIRGGWFEVDGKQLTFPEKRTVQLEEKRRLDTGQTASLSAIFGLLYEARMKRIYIYGLSLLALGFLLQLIDLLVIFPSPLF